MSTSGNTGYAKSGDTITLTITASEAVTGLTCTIDGETATMGGSGTSWTAALTISGDETAGAATFSNYLNSFTGIGLTSFSTDGF